jgi:glycine oxidase
MARPDVVVLGGGIIGCSLAEELAKRRLRVMVVERGAVGQEASSAAVGILSAQMDLERPGPFFALCQAARRMYPGWVKRLERRSGVPVGYHVDGLLYVAQTRRRQQAMAQQARWQRQQGRRVEDWTVRDVRRREPAVDGPLLGGWYFPEEAQVDNVALMQALALTVRRLGVSLRERTAVRRLVVRHGAVRGVVTSQGEVRASCVVNCLGSWSAMGETFPVRLPVTPARGQILAFAGPPRLLRHILMSEPAYAVQRRDGRVLVGSTIEQAGFDKSLTLAGIHKIVVGVHRMTSALDRCRLLATWAGFRPQTPDGLPILGSTGIGGLYVATGHFRHGILLAPITATLLAELILHGRTSLDLASFAPQRFA